MSEDDAKVGFRHNVPTHLDAPDGVGKLSVRQMTLLVGSTMCLAPAAALYTPQLGPTIGDALANTALTYFVPPGTLALSTILTSVTPVLGAGVLALPFDPPIEHGLVNWMRYRTKPRILGPELTSELIGHPTVERDIVHVFGHHVAMWDMPSVSMRLASDTARNVHRARWARFLDGVPCPIQTMVRCTPVDLKAVLARMAKDPNPNASRVASYLAASSAHGGEIHRRRLLSISSSDPDQLRVWADDVESALARATLGGKRLVDEDLADAVHGYFSRKPRRKGRIGPLTMRIEADAIQADGEWLSTGVLQRWPSAVALDFLSPFYDGNDDVDVLQNIVPQNMVDVRRKLENRLQRLETTTQTRQRKVAIRQLEAMLDALEEHKERVFAVDQYLLVRAGARPAVRTKRQHMQQTAEEIGAQVDHLRWEHTDGLVSASGLGQVPTVRRTHLVDTSSISRAFPWGASELALPGAVPWGVSLHGNRRVAWTPWARPTIPNPHLAMYATTGGGKGFTVKIFDSRAIFAGIFAEAFYTDQAPESEDGEYGRFARYVGGEMRKLHAPLDEAELRDALAGIAEGRPIPRCIVLNTARLSRHDQCRAFVALKRAVWRRAALIRALRRIGVDETWVYVEDKEASDEGEDIVRTGRRMKVAGAFQTQRPMDALDSKLGGIIQSQCATQWYGMQNDSEISDVGRRLRWTSEQEEAIAAFGQGDGFLKAGLHRVAFRADYTPEEFDMAQTDTVAAELDPAA
jgi:hypothetical protein